MYRHRRQIHQKRLASGAPSGPEARLQASSHAELQAGLPAVLYAGFTFGSTLLSAAGGTHPWSCKANVEFTITGGKPTAGNTEAGPQVELQARLRAGLKVLLRKGLQASLPVGL